MLIHILFILPSVIVASNFSDTSSSIRKLRQAVFEVANQLDVIVGALDEILGEQPKTIPSSLEGILSDKEGVVVDPVWLKKAIEVMYKDTMVSHSEDSGYLWLKLEDMRNRLVAFDRVWLWEWSMWFILLFIDTSLTTVLMIYAKGGRIDVRDRVTMYDWILNKLLLSIIITIILRGLSFIFAASDDSLVGHIIDAALVTLRVLGVITILINQTDGMNNHKTKSSSFTSRGRSVTPQRKVSHYAGIRTPDFRSPSLEGVCKPRVIKGD